jgi:thiol-disulfide isomerase/thioredoxin
MQPNTPSGRHPINWPKYIVALIITTLIFGSALYVNNVLDQKRVANVENVRDQIALDLLSSETQFNLLSETSCANLGSNALSEELNSLASKLELMEANDIGQKSAELVYLKKYYSLLEMKDFILMNQLRSKCSQKPLSILYFYGNSSDCPGCSQTAIVLNALRQQYEDLRVYSFDMNLDLTALQTLKSMYKIDAKNLPALVINEKRYVGFKSIDEIKSLIPELKKIDAQRERNAAASSSSASSASRTKAPTSTSTSTASTKSQ